MTTLRISKAYATYHEEGGDIVIDIFGAPPSEIEAITIQLNGKNSTGLEAYTEEEIKKYVKNKFFVEDWVSVEAEPEYWWN